MTRPRRSVNTVAALKSDADRWTGVDDSAGEGVAREDI